MVNAVVILKGVVSGLIMFSQKHESSQTRISGAITGLAPGSHGFHIHESGNITAGCAGAGPHYNPFNKHHGGPRDSDRHVGDLGNIVANQLGIALVDFKDSQVSLMGAHNVLDRALVLHADADDLGKGGASDSLTTGHAGNRVACGVIRSI